MLLRQKGMQDLKKRGDETREQGLAEDQVFSEKEKVKGVPALSWFYFLFSPMTTSSVKSMNRSGSRNRNAQLFLLVLRILSTVLLSTITMLRHFHLCFSVTVMVTTLRTSFFLSHVYRVTCTHLKGSPDQRRLKNIPVYDGQTSLLRLLALPGARTSKLSGTEGI